MPEFEPHQWNYEEAGIDWRARAMEAAHTAGVNAIRAQDAEAALREIKERSDRIVAGELPTYTAATQISNIARRGLDAVAFPRKDGDGR